MDTQRTTLGRGRRLRAQLPGCHAMLGVQSLKFKNSKLWVTWIYQSSPGQIVRVSPLYQKPEKGRFIPLIVNFWNDQKTRFVSSVYIEIENWKFCEVEASLDALPLVGFSAKVKRAIHFPERALVFVCEGLTCLRSIEQTYFEYKNKEKISDFYLLTEKSIQRMAVYSYVSRVETGGYRTS